MSLFEKKVSMSGLSTRDNTPLNFTILFIIFARQSALAKNGQPTGLTRPVSTIFQTIHSVDIRFLDSPSPVPILGSSEIQLLYRNVPPLGSVYSLKEQVHQNVFHLGCCRSDRFYCLRSNPPVRLTSTLYGSPLIIPR